MAASRKLQGEIERCLKKVTEGVDTFEDIWQKVHNAANSNQKEKYETDLKKEIKKLQRLRDQIKSWIASAEIKDKTNLIEYRKLIETQMERFKVVERETKTKAYSKEGLGAIQKVDPVRKERQEASCWLVQSIDSLNLQVDKFESELELLIANNKKKRDKDKQDRIEGLKTKLEKHRFHIKQLEMLLRMLDNMSVEPDQIRKIKDDIEYYIESAFDMDFHDNEYIYDDIMGAVKAAADAAEAAGENEANGEDESEQLNPVIDGTAIPIAESAESSSTIAISESATATINAALIENHSNEDSSVTTAVSMEEKKKEKEKSIRSTPVTSTVTTLTTNIIKPTPVKAGNAVNATVSSTSTNSSNCSNVINVSVNNINSSISNSSILSAVNASAGGVRSSSGITAVNLTSNIVNANSIPAASSATKSSLSSSTIVNHSAAPIPVTSTVINTTVGNFATVAASNPHHSSYPNKPSAAAVLAANLHSHAPVENGILPSQPHMKDSSSLMSNVTATAQSYYSSAHPNSAASSVPSSVHSLSSTPASCDQHNNIGARSSTTTPSSLSNAPSPSPRTPPISQQIEQHASSIPQHNSVFEKNQTLYNSNTTQNNFTINVKGNNVSNNSNNGNSSDGNIDSSSRSNCSGESSSSGLSNEQANEYYESLIPPLLGVAPLGAIPLDKEYQMQYAKLEAAFSRMPHPSDTERTKPHLPRIPCKVPEHYTEVAVFNCDTIEFFLRLTPETLFFIFYYMEGTKAQFLAAQALKKQSWRFHTKYMMWFQRHEEPKTINDDFEQGTYIYFDFEKWSQRKKEGFTFEYKYLEDKEF